MAKTKAVKICVVGPKCTGKTVLCKVLAEQVLNNADYQPTAALRIQMLERVLKGQNAHIQLWDSSGDPVHEKYFPVISKDADGVILVHDLSKAQEAELETLYRIFAQPNKLTMNQVLIVGISKSSVVDKQSLKGKLNSLQQIRTSIGALTNNDPVGDSLSVLNKSVDKLFSAALARKERS